MSVTDEAAESELSERRRAPLPRNVFWLSIASMFNDISGEIITRGLPIFLAGTLGVDKAVIGLIEGLSDTVASLLKVLSGWYSDRWGSRKRVAATGYALTAIARPLLFFATSWVLPMMLKVLDRTGKGIRTAPRDALIADSVEPELRGRAFGFHRALDPLGAVIGALGAALLLYTWRSSPVGTISAHEWKLLVLVASVPTAISVCILTFLVKEKKRELRVPPPFRNILQVGRDKRFLQLLGILVLFTLGASSDAFILLRAQSLGLSIWEIFLLVAVFNLVTTALAYPAGVLSDRVGRRALILSGWILYALLYLGFALSTTNWEIWVLFVLYGAYYGLTEGAERALVADLVQPEERGAAFGLYNGAAGLALLPASLIAGALWQSYGPAAPFYFGAGMAALASILLLAMRGIGRTRQVEAID